jgi:hypothetical protein
MKIDKVFVSVHAKDFDALSRWWTTLLERKWDHEPMPTCHEWDIAGCALFQVLDSSESIGKTTVTLRVLNLNAHVERLRREGVTVPAPIKIEGFENLWFCRFQDPEGNNVGLVEGGTIAETRR